MLPVIALVGRPNVGKSTLYNRLTRSRDALVAELPGLTRDRIYGECQIGSRACIVIDTGGLTDDADGIAALMTRQAWLAIGEADHVFFLLDARAGLNASDEEIAGQLRRSGKAVTLLANKSEGLGRERAALEFHALGLGDPVAISAERGDGVDVLMESVLAGLPAVEDETDLDDATQPIRIAVVGRPNVGKSTLVNRLVGEERVLAFDEPGTTRDSIRVPFERDGEHFILIDTAGVRRRSRVHEAIEKFSVLKAMQALASAQVAVLVFDAAEGISEQDATLAGHVLESGRALVLAVNKWDGLSLDQRDTVRRNLEFKLPFLEFAETHFISALHGSGVGDMLDAVRRAHASAIADFATAELTRILEQALHAHQPPLVRGRRIKLRYAHQGGRNPPLIIIHGNQTEHIPDSYRRYLSGTFRKTLNLTGTPVRLEFRTGTNPFKGRRNVLTPRQVQSRKRIIKKRKGS